MKLMQATGAGAIRVTAVAAVMAGLLASPASAGVISQTMTYSDGPAGSPPASSPWTHTFSFAAFKGPDPSAKLTGVRLIITGSQVTQNGTLDCVFGDEGLGTGTSFCSVKSYKQQGVFSLLSPLALSGFVSDLTVAQSASFNPVHVLREDIMFGPNAPVSFAETVDGATASGTYDYYSQVVGAGGTLDPALFTNINQNVDLTYKLTSSASVDLGTTDGTAELGFNSIVYSMTASLYYDYVETPEPRSLAIFAVALASLAIVRRRSRGG